MAFEKYIRELVSLRDHPEATPELSLRPPLQRLLEDYCAASSGIVIPEARRNGRQPDFTLKTGNFVIGYVETKAPGADLTPDTDQLKAYVRGLDNLLLTDYDTFRLNRRETCVLDASLGIQSAIRRGSTLKVPTPSTDKQQHLNTLLETFVGFRMPGISKPSDLAYVLARRTAILRSAIQANLVVEESPFEHLYDFYKKSLYPDMGASVFADTAAQTVTYGLFLARLNHDELEPFSVRNARFNVPENVQFLRSALLVLSDEDEINSDVRWIVDDISEVLRDCDIAAISALLEKTTEDAVLYFYEPFLHEYDPDERMDRGVYYTPVPLVQYIVRNVDNVLQATFAKRLGFGNSDVTILDPATGTGTFPLSILSIATETIIREEGDAVASDFLRNDLIKRLIGFEVLPAPYTIAHLRLAEFYKRRGIPLTGEHRFRVYITNTVSAPTQRPGHGQHLPILQSLVDEVLAADQVKTEQPILVILGNPPYDRNSRFNRNAYIDALMMDFRRDAALVDEENKKSLNDDYVKFFRWAVNKLLELESSYRSGVLAFVSNSSYLGGIAFPGMRKWLLEHFSDIYVFDLHGNRRAAIRGRVDENVFVPVKAGIAITIAIRDRTNDTSCRVHYNEAWGSRQEKFSALDTATLNDGSWSSVIPKAPAYSFLRDTAGADYASWPPLPSIFKAKLSGVQTSRDALVVSIDPNDFPNRLQQLNADSGLSNEELRVRYKLRDGGGFSLGAVRTPPVRFDESKVHRYLYRELDYRYIYFDDRLVARPRHTISDHMLSGTNVAIISPRLRRGDGQGVTVSNAVSDLNVMGSGIYVYPRYCIPDAAHAGSMHGGITPNIMDCVTVSLGAQYGTTVSCDDVFDYAVAVLASTRFGARFGDAWALDHPRVPFPTDEDAFRSTSSLGGDLRRAQLFDFPQGAIGVRINGNGLAAIQEPHYEPESRSVIIATGLTLEPIPRDVWGFKMGQHFVLEEYLSARAGLVLSRDQMTDLRRVVHSISLTLKILEQLDPLVEDVLSGETFTADSLGLPV